MANRNLEATWAYHDATKHSRWSVRSSTHYLDWSNQPLPFKIYRTLPPISLPLRWTDDAPGAISTLSAISEEFVVPAGEAAVPDLEALARILYFSAGITKKKTYSGREIYFRAASCTGALYEVELYVVCGNLPDLEPGVYHFGPADFALRKLRSGDYRDVLLRATAGEPAVAQAPVTLVCTCNYWRNAWKYQARTYRHFGWDNGTMLANTLAMCSALKLPGRVVCGFVDSEVNRLLSIDPRREVAFSLVPVGQAPASPTECGEEIVPLSLETVPLSRTEVEYSIMQDMHRESSLGSEEEVASWRGLTALTDRPWPMPRAGQCVPLPPSKHDALPPDSIEQVIQRRGSTRQFAREPITLAQLSTLFDYSTRGIPADYLQPFGEQLNELYLIVNAVEGLKPGAYVFHRRKRMLECLNGGDFRNEASYLGLEQELPGDASVAIFYLADLPAILDRFGNRGYRAVQLEAGILGGKMYLAAYAHRLGATGLTFFDDDVTRFFSPHAAGMSAIFLMAVGRSARRQ
jgi:SagB-type dehydrogenase family enzyme